jgi:RHS repeat-associated protein
MSRTPLAALAVLTIAGACGGVHDSVAPELDAKHFAPVGDNDPLPIPSDTVGPPDVGSGKVAVGTLPAHSEISDDGIARYSIPLWVPPGRAGMEPELALEYQSRGGDGIAGVGWSLSGFSQISRCTHSVAVEGKAGPVRFDATDALCLDGEHLKNANNAAHPVYKTEHDSFTVIYPDSPTAFSAYHRDGRIYRYTGYLQGRKVPVVWALTRIEDRYGNTIDFTYISNDKTASAFDYLYPDTISYTGSTAGSAVAPNRQVKFLYDLTGQRGDYEFSAAVGQTQLTRRLDRIEMYGPDVQSKKARLRTYDLGYVASSSASRRTLLASISSGDDAGNKIGLTTFQWSAGTPGFSRFDSAVNDYLNNVYQAGYRLVDLNGDGFADLFYVVKGPSGDPEYAVRFWEPGHSDFGARIDWLIKPTTDFSGVYTFPMPALSDASTSLGILMWQQLPGPSAYAPVMRQVQPLPTGLIEFGVYYPFPTAVNVAFPADFDGDGLADVITGETSATANSIFRVYKNLGGHPAQFDNGTVVQIPWVGTGMAQRGAIAPFRGVDFDGDGRQELTVCFPKGGRAVVGIDAGYLTDPFPACPQRPVFLDFNGDGLDDALQLGGQYDEVKLFLNGGPGSLTDHTPSIGGAISGPTTYNDGTSQAVILDYDLDGHPDVLFINGDRSTHLKTFRTPNTKFADLVDANVSVPAGDANTLPQVGDMNGDGLDDIITVENGRFGIYLRNGDRPDMLTGVVDAYGAQTTFVYRPISDSTIYTPGPITGARYPIRPVNNGVWVATQRTTSTSARGRTETEYHKYEAATEDIQRGFLGFAAHETEWFRDEGTVTQRLEFDNSRQKNVDPFVGFPIRDTTTVRDKAGKLVHQSVRQQTPVMEYDSDFATWWVHPGTVTTTNYDPDSSGALAVTYSDTVTVAAVDRVGHVTSATEFEGDGTSRTYDATYQYQLENWLVDMPTKIVTTSTGRRPCPTCRAVRYVRNVGFKYDAKGGLEWDVLEPDYDSSNNMIALAQPQPDGTQTLVTHLVRDADGQIGSVTEDIDFTATAHQRVLTLYRDAPDRVFVSRVKNKLGHMLHLATHPGLGVLAATQDANGQYSAYRYDTFGRLKHSAPANNEPATLNYLGYTLAGRGPALLELHRVGDAGDDQAVLFDLLGNVAGEKTKRRNDGQIVVVERTYDVMNQLVGVTRPHFIGSSAAASDRWHYDAAGRLVRREMADGRVEQYAYSGASDGLHVDRWDADPTNAAAIHSTATFNLASLPVSNTQHAAAFGARPARDVTVTYGYGAFDVLTSIVSNGVVTTLAYDRDGRGTWVSDASNGSRAYSFDAFGERVTETINGEVRTQVYDDLGRPQTLQTRDGTTTWNWDLAANGVGKLASLVSPTGVTTALSYDGQSRLTDETQTIGSASYHVSFEQDTYGRLQRLFYPTVNGARLTLRYGYGAHGALSSITNDTTKAPLWSLVESDAAGKPTNPSDAFPQYLLGGKLQVRYIENATRPGILQQIQTTAGTTLQSLSYVFDGKGNVHQRTDDQRGLGETFDYDELNRLARWTVASAGGPSTVRYDYNDAGDLTGRTYEAGSGTNMVFGYTGERGAGPYAVTSANAVLFGYDGEGNQSQSGQRTLAASAFGLPLSITQGATTVEFRYDGNGQRAEKRVTSGGAVTDDTIFVGGIYRKHTANGADDHGFVIAGPNGAVAYLTVAADGTTSTSYIVPDHLGSPDTIVDGKTWQVTETRKFDPFGNRIDPLNPLGPVPAKISPVPFGFTGHDQDWDLGLVDMKARLFDPSTGRFLSPDPTTQSTSVAAGLDNYAYALDNPATYADHTGLYVDNSGDPGGDDGSGFGFGPIGITWGSGGGGSSGDSRRNISHTGNKPVYNAVDPAALRTTVAGRSYSSDRVYAERSGKLAQFSDWVVDHPYKGFAVIFAGVFTGGMTGGVVYGLATGTLVVGAGTAAVGASTAPLVPIAPKVAELVEDDAPAAEAEADAAAKTAASVVDKLNRYLLNPDHPVGGSKAAWFEKALGFTRANLQDLAKQIVFDPKTAFLKQASEWGPIYNQVIRIVGPNGKIIDVTFGWIVRNEDGIARLTTAIPTKQ